MSATGVPTGDPHHKEVTGGAWSTGLCGCFSDVPNCKLSLMSYTLDQFTINIHQKNSSMISLT